MNATTKDVLRTLSRWFFRGLLSFAFLLIAVVLVMIVPIDETSVFQTVLCVAAKPLAVVPFCLFVLINKNNKI